MNRRFLRRITHLFSHLAKSGRPVREDGSVRQGGPVRQGGFDRRLRCEPLEDRRLLDAVGVSDGDAPFAPVFKIDDVLVRGSDWTDGFLDALDRCELGNDTLDHLGYSVCGAADAHASVPWTNVDTIVARFTEDVDVRADDMRLFGVAISAYTKEYGIGLEDFEYDPVSHVASWTFNQALPKDRLLLTLDGQLASKSSGAGGGNFELRFDVLPGDQDSDGLVHISEALVYRDRLLGRVKSDDFPVRMDLNGDGLINAADVLVYRDIVLDTLPKGGPGIETVSGTAGDDRLEITAVDDDSIAYSLNGGPVVTVDGIYGLEFNGLGGDDRMVLDFSSSTTLPAGGIDYDGGDNTPGGEDVLEVQGGAFDSVANTIGGPDAGSLALGVGGGSSEIRYVGSESTDIGSSATVVRFDLPGIADPNVVLEDWGAGQGRLMQQTTFDYPADGGELIINLGDDDQALIVDSLDLNANTRLTLDGQGGDDAVVFDAPGLTITRDLWVTAETVVQTEEMAVAGLTVLNAGTTGTIALSDPQNDFGGDVRIADAGNAALRDKNDLAVSLAWVSNDLTLTADTGDLALGEVTVSAGTATLTAAAGNITDTNGTVLNVAAVDASIVAQGSIGSDTDLLETSLSGMLTATAPGGIYLSETGDLVIDSIDAGMGEVRLEATGTITDAPGNDTTTDITAGDLTVLSAAGIGTSVGDALNLNVTNVALGTAAAIGGAVYLTEEAWLGLGTIDAGTNSVYIETLVGAMTDDASDVRASVLTLDSAGAIGTETEPINVILSGTVTATALGGIYLKDTGGLMLSDIETTGGSVWIRSSGGILAGNVVANSDVTLIADTGDLALGVVTASGGTATLTATAGSITDTNGTVLNVTAANAEITAGGADAMIGSDADPVEIALSDALTATAANGVGGIYVSESDAMSITLVAAGAGDIELRADGVIDEKADDQSVKIVTTGTLLLEAAGAIGNDADTNAPLDIQVGELTAEATAPGGIYLKGAGGVTLTDIETVGGNVWIRSSGGIVVGNVVANGDVTLIADTGDLLLDAVTASGGTVTLTTTVGSIVDDNGTTLNVTADALAMRAGVKIGDADPGSGSPTQNENAIDTQVATLAAVSAEGIYVLEVDGVTIDAAGADPSLSDLRTTGDGPIKVVTLTGDLTVVEGAANLSDLPGGVVAGGAGDVLLEARGGNVVLDASVAGSAGRITVTASDTISQNAGMLTGGGTLLINAGDSIVMAPGTSTASGGGNIRLDATSDISLGLLDAGAGDVLLLAGGNIVGANGAALNVAANALAMRVGGSIGGSDVGNGAPMQNANAIDTSVSILAAEATDGIYLLDSDGFTIGTVAGVGVEQVNFNSTISPVPSESVSGFSSVNGPIKLTVATGELAVSAPVQAGNGGNILLRAADGDVTLGADVSSDSGHITVSASGAVTQDADVSTIGGTVFVAAGDSIAMTPGTSTTSGGGNVRLEAANDLAVGEINVGMGDVSLVAGGNIVDSNGAAPNVLADALAMWAGGKIGDADALNGTPTQNVKAIDTSVNVLAAEAGSGIYVLESDGLAVDGIDPIDVTRVNFNSTTAAVPGIPLSDLRTTDGPIKVVVLTGDLTVNEGVTNPADLPGGVAAGGSGDVLLETRAGHVTLNAAVTSGSGHITVSASGAVTQGAAVTSGGGDIYFTAGGDILVGEINAGSGDVALDAGGSILDGNASALNVTADALAMNAGGKIGDVDAGSAASDNLNAIDTSVNVLAAEAGSGIYVLESGGLAVDGIDPIDVTRVNFNSTTAAVAGIPLSDLRTTAGPIKVVVLTGDLTVNEGMTNPADLLGGVAAGGSDVLLAARSGDVILNAAVGSGSGHITVSASGLVTQDAAVASGGGDIYFTAGGDILVGEINAGSGDVALDAGGSILDGNTSGLNITADALAMNAGGKIGDADALNGTPTQNVNAIDTSVNVLAAEAASGIYVLESDGLAVDGIDPIDVTRVNFNSTTAAVPGIPLSDLRTTDGPIKVVVLTGDLTVNEGVTNPADLPGGVAAGGSGDVLLAARGGDMILNAAVSSGSGHVTVSANGLVRQDAAVASGGGDIYFTAGGDILVGEINAGSGDVALDAGGSILDGNASALNVTADALAMNAGGKIGDADALNGTPAQNVKAIDTSVNVLAAEAADSIYVLESGGLAVDGVDPIDVMRVDFNSTTAAVPGIPLSDLRTTAGPIKVVVLTGDLTVNEGVTNPADLPGGVAAGGSGDVLLETRGGDMILNAMVTSGSGHITVSASGDVVQNTDIVTGGGTVLIVGGNEINVQSGSTNSSGGNIRLDAGTSIGLGRINAGTGDVSLVAGGDIVDNNGGAVNVLADALAMWAGGKIGDVDAGSAASDNLNAIDTSVNVLAAEAGECIYVLGMAGVTVDDTEEITVQQVNFNSTTTSLTDRRSDLRTTDGPIKVVVLTGDLTVNEGATNPADLPGGVAAGGSGDVLLETRTDNGDVTLNADVSSGSGYISVVAMDDVYQNANILTGGATVYVLASNGTRELPAEEDGIVMAPGTSTTSGGENIRMEAGGQGDIHLALVDAGTSDVSLLAEGSIYDNDPGALNVTADALIMTAGGAIGGSDAGNGAPIQNANAIDTSVNILAAKSADGIYVWESDGITIDTISGVDVTRVRFNSTTSPVLGTSLSDLTTTANGPIKVVVAAGTLRVNEGDPDDSGVATGGNGDVLLETRADDGDVILNANVSSGSGHVSVVAGDDVSQNANIATGGGSILVRASNGQSESSPASNGIVMASGTSTTSGGGNIRLEADNEGDILLEEIITGTVTGAVSLAAEGSIHVDPASPLAVNITAHTLAMEADAALSNNPSNQRGWIGSGGVGTENAVETAVTILAAKAAEGIYVLEADGVTVDDTGEIQVQRVYFNSTTDDWPEPAHRLSDLRTTNGGPIKLATEAGDLTVNEGGANPSDQTAGVAADGSGNVLLDAAGDVGLTATVTSGSGHISIVAKDDVHQNANIETGGGTVYVSASNETRDTDPADDGIVMASGTTITSGDNILLQAEGGGDIRLALVDAGMHDVSLLAEGNIVDSSGGAVNVLADALAMWAGGKIGDADMGNGTPEQNAKAIDTSVNVLAAESGSGIYVLEANGVTVDDTGLIEVEQVHFNSTTTKLTDRRSDLRTTDGPIKVVTLLGDLTVEEGSANPADVSGGMAAGGSGDVLLEAREEDALADVGNVTLRADVTAGTGHISIVAKDDVYQNANIETGGGTVYVSASNTTADTDPADDGIVMASGATITSANENVRLDSGADIDLGVLNAGTGKVLLVAGGNIEDANGAALNVTAGTLAVTADADDNGTGRIGEGVADKAIDTSVGVLAAKAAGGIYVLEVDGVTIDAIAAIEVARVNFNSTTDPLLGSPLSDLTTTIDGPIKLAAKAGSLRVKEGDADDSGVAAGGSGDVLLDARAGDVVLDANVSSGSGHVMVHALGTIAQNADVDVETGDVGTILIEAGGSIEMVSGTSTTSGGANIRLGAGTNIDLGVVNAGMGDVLLVAGTDIEDANGAALNVTAGALAMTADSDDNGTGRIGEGVPDKAIDTSVGVLAAKAAGGIYVLEENGVTVDATGAIDVKRVLFDATPPESVAGASLSDLTTTGNGPIKLAAEAGTLRVEEGDADDSGVAANGTGDVLLDARAGNVELEANVSSDGGHITVHASADVAQDADIETGAGSILVEAGGSILMEANTSTTSGGANIRLAAGANIDLGVVNAGTGDVILIAGTNIEDANGAALNVTAGVLAMTADSDDNGTGRIGEGVPDKAIDTSVGVLAAKAAGGIYVLERDEVFIDDTEQIGVERVNFNSTTTTLTDRRSDLRTTNDGSIELETESGDLTVNEGSANPTDVSGGVAADGSGYVLLDAAGDVELTAAVTSDSGDISVVADQDVLQRFRTTPTPEWNGAVTGGGTVLVDAGRDFIMEAEDSGTAPADGTSITSRAENVDVRAGHDIAIPHGATISAVAEGVTLSMGQAGAGGTATIAGTLRTDGRSIVINGGAGADTLMLVLSTVKLKDANTNPVGVQYDGGGDVDTLFLEGTEQDDHFCANDKTGRVYYYDEYWTVPDPLVQYANVEKLKFNTLEGNDEVTFRMGAGNVTNVYMDGGDGGGTVNEDAFRVFGTYGKDGIFIDDGVAGNDYDDSDPLDPFRRDGMEAGAVVVDCEIKNVEGLQVYAGSGDDGIVNDTAVNSLLLGNAGNDKIIGGVASDVIFGGDHLDRLLGRAGNDYLFLDHTFAPPETLYELPTVDGETAEGGTGDDVIVSKGLDIVDGGDGTYNPNNPDTNNTFIIDGAEFSIVDWLFGRFAGSAHLEDVIDEISRLYWVKPFDPDCPDS